MKGYFITDTGYVVRYGEAEEGTANFVASDQLPSRTREGLCLRANDDRTEIDYVPITHIASPHPVPPALQIRQLKARLAATDYQAIKFAEGELTEAEYEPTRQQRAAWRAEINLIEN